MKTLAFTQIRQGTPQWEVTFNNKKIARITQRIIAEPVYVVVLLDNNEEKFFSTKEEILIFLHEKVGLGPPCFTLFEDRIKELKNMPDWFVRAGLAYLLDHFFNGNSEELKQILIDFGFEGLSERQQKDYEESLKIGIQLPSEILQSMGVFPVL